MGQSSGRLGQLQQGRPVGARHCRKRRPVISGPRSPNPHRSRDLRWSKLHDASRDGVLQGLNFHNALSIGGAGTSSGLTSINFYDGTVLALGQGAPLPFTWIGGQYANMSGSNFGTNTFEFGTGPETATGGDTGNRYLLSPSSGQASIYANQTSGSTDELDFSGGIDHDDLWFRQSGTDLRIDVVGTNTNVTVKDWFAGASHELNEINAGGRTLDSQVSQLVQAMASFTSTNPSFDPTSTSAVMPQTSQSKARSRWHGTHNLLLRMCRDY